MFFLQKIIEKGVIAFLGNNAQNLVLPLISFIFLSYSKMLNELQNLDRVTILRQAYLKALRSKVKELVDSLTDEQILSGNF